LGRAASQRLYKKLGVIAGEIILPARVSIVLDGKASCVTKNAIHRRATFMKLGAPFWIYIYYELVIRIC